MATQIRSTYVADSATDIIKILKTNLWFSTMTSSKKVSIGDSSNAWQPKMAAKTGNNFISETVRDSVEISTANLGVYLQATVTTTDNQK